MHRSRFKHLSLLLRSAHPLRPFSGAHLSSQPRRVSNRRRNLDRLGPNQVSLLNPNFGCITMRLVMISGYRGVRRPSNVRDDRRRRRRDIREKKEQEFSKRYRGPSVDSIVTSPKQRVSKCTARLHDGKSKTGADQKIYFHRTPIPYLFILC